VWKECNRCKVRLVNARAAHVMKWLKVICVLVTLWVLVAASTYCIQPAERQLYERAYACLKEGRYGDAQKQWRRAFARSPYVTGARSLVEEIKARLRKHT
jgi:TolA-binding protein